MFSSCSFSVTPNTNGSSAMPVTPFSPSSAESRCFWNTSYETTRPKGSRVKQNLPNGVLKEVK